MQQHLHNIAYTHNAVVVFVPPAAGEAAGRVHLLQPEIKWASLAKGPLLKLIKDVSEGVAMPDLLQVCCVSAVDLIARQ